MLTVRDIADLPGLGLELTAGSAGSDNPIRWVHVSELPDARQRFRERHTMRQFQ